MRVTTSLFFLFLPIGCLFAEFRIGMGNRYGSCKEISTIEWEEIKVQSKLKWRKINIVDWTCVGIWQWKPKGYFRLDFGLGVVNHANIEDADYYLKNSLLEKELFSLSHHSSGDGEFILISGSVGRRYSPWNCLHLIPSLGFSFRQHRFTITGGHNLFAKDFVLSERIRRHLYEGCCSYSRRRQYSPWIGLDYCFNALSNLVIQGKMQFHLAFAKTRKNWNLRSLHFTELSAGPGLVMEVELLAPMERRRYLGFKIGFEKWEMRGPPLTLTFYEEAVNGIEKVDIDTNVYKYFFDHLIFGMVYAKSF